MGRQLPKGSKRRYYFYLYLDDSYSDSESIHRRRRVYTLLRSERIENKEKKSFSPGVVPFLGAFFRKGSVPRNDQCTFRRSSYFLKVFWLKKGNIRLVARTGKNTTFNRHEDRLKM